MNSTPLFHVPVDPTDDDDVLTPYHFLIGRLTPCYPLEVFKQREISLWKRWRCAQALADAFWRRWVREYLPTLSLHTKWNEPQRDIEEGDLVIIADEQHLRNLWLKGVVTTIFKSPDGALRSAVVKTKLGVLRRPQ